MWSNKIKRGTPRMKVAVGNEKLMYSCAKVHSVADNNMEDDESHQEEEDDDSSKQEKADSERQSEDEKEEDKEYDDENLEEELQTLFNTTYAETKMKSSCSSLKYVFAYVYHGSRLSRSRWNVEIFYVSLYESVN